MLRTGSKALALATLLLDGGKGALAALLVGALGARRRRWSPAPAPLLGHLFPVWLGFRGGKGVATTLGVLLAIAWPVGIGALVLSGSAAPPSSASPRSPR